MTPRQEFRGIVQSSAILLLQQLHHQCMTRACVTCQACICFDLCVSAVSSKAGQVGQDIWLQQAESESGQAYDIEDSCSANWSDLWKHAACGAGIVGAWYLLHIHRRHVRKHRRSDRRWVRRLSNASCMQLRSRHLPVPDISLQSA